MGLGVQALNLMLSLWKDGWFDGAEAVIELGSQDLHAPHDEISIVFEELLKTELPSATDFYTPETFYNGIGFKNYKCIDMDGRHNALMFDLNKNIRTEYGFNEQFNLVTNHGTTEHCFDQHQVFRNIHELCFINGIMLHAVPFQGYLNHGYYNYQPSFFRDIAAANDYRMIGMYLALDAEVADICTYSDKLMEHLYLGQNPTMLLFAVMQKRDAEDFRFPYDRKYFARPQGVQKQQFQKVPTRYFQPEPFDIINHVRTVQLAKLLWKRIVAKIASYRS